MKLIDFILRFAPKRGRVANHPLFEQMAAIQAEGRMHRTPNGLSPRLVIMDEAQHTYPPGLREDQRRVNLRESLITEILANTPVWHAYEWVPAAVRDRRIRAIYARLEPHGA